MKIAVLEKIGFTKKQADRLNNLGDVAFFDSSSEEECVKRIKGADVVVVDWIDPTVFLLSMKSPSLLALLSTGYGWIKYREDAKDKGILISNVPGYATEAVAEHIMGLLLCVARETMVGDRDIRSGKKEKGRLQGIELKGRKIGIIGLGKIGMRVAELSAAFGMDVITYNRHKKSCAWIKDVSLNELLSSSDVVCVSCPQNENSKGLLGKERLKLMKKDSILVGATWGVVVMDDLIPLLKSRYIRGAGFDVAIEGECINSPQELLKLNNVVITPHIGYNTDEAAKRQIDICISNIEAFKKGNPTNIIN